MPIEPAPPLQDWAALAHALAWPVVALLGLIRFHQPIARLIDKLGKRLETANTVTLGTSGLKLEGQIAQNATRIEALEITQKVAQSRTARIAPRAAASPIHQQIPDALAQMAKTYREVNLPDYAARVSRKDQLANDMGALIAEQDIPRDLLAATTDEGLIVALATAIIANPLPEDLPRLLNVSRHITRKHVAYRVVLALAQLTNLGYVAPAQAPSVMVALNGFQTFADDALRRAITRAEWSLSSRT